jgi:hypothetical protein
MSAEFMMLSHGIAGNIQNHKSMLRRQVVRGLIERYGNMQTLSLGADLAWRIAAMAAGAGSSTSSSREIILLLYRLLPAFRNITIANYSDF